MPRKRFTNAQIAFALRQAEDGATLNEICRKMGMSERNQPAGTTPGRSAAC